MDLSIERIGSVTVVRVPGEFLDASTVKAFKEGIGRVIDGGADKVVLDMSHLQFVDSSGLGAILSCLRKLNSAGGDLKLIGMTRPVRALFELVRMHRIMDIYDTETEALRAFSK